MNVLLASDGSPQARAAEELVSSIQWPERTRITAIQVHELMPTVRGLPDDMYLALYEDAHKRIDEHLEALATKLSRPGREVDVRLMNGRPASEIVEEARRTAADLVVVGSRGPGRSSTTCRPAPSASSIWPRSSRVSTPVSR